MKSIARYELPLERLAIAVAVIGCFVACLLLTREVTRSNTLRWTIADKENALAMLAAENASAERQVAEAEARANAIAAEVSRELKTRQNMMIAMGDVLARAKVLQEHRGRFEAHRSDVAQKMDTLTEAYFRVNNVGR